MGEGKYLAPETINCDDPAEIDLKKVDLYAFGRTLIEVMLNRRISTDVEDAERKQLKDISGIKRLLEETKYSQGLKDYVIMLNSPNPDKRLSTRDYSIYKGLFRTKSENERVWLKHLKVFLERKFRDLENSEEKVKKSKVNSK